jgi:hypothetical protein
MNVIGNDPEIEGISSGACDRHGFVSPFGTGNGSVAIMPTTAQNRAGQPAECERARPDPIYWKQWKQPRTRRRHLLALGADPETVHMATRSRKGYWRMSQNEIVRFALNNHWLEEQGVPDLKAIWIQLHYGPDARV